MNERDFSHEAVLTQGQDLSVAHLGDAATAERGLFAGLAENRLFVAASALGATLAATAAIGVSKANAAPAKVVESSATNLYIDDLTPAVRAAQVGDPVTTDQFGAKVINSIPGVSTDVTQKVESAQQLPDGSTQVSYVCPAPSKTSYKIGFKSITLKDGNKADAVFCPSFKAVDFSSLKSAGTAGPLASFQSDPLRGSNEWLGDRSGKALFDTCPQDPKNQTPNPTFTYNKANKSVSAKVWSGGGVEYCDKVGQSHQELSVQVSKGKGKAFKQVGNSVIHVTSLPEILSFSYKAPEKYLQPKVTIPNVEGVCVGGGKNVRARVKVISRFVAMKSQTFQHNADGRSDVMKSGSRTFTSAPKKIC